MTWYNFTSTIRSYEMIQAFDSLKSSKFMFLVWEISSLASLGDTLGVDLPAFSLPEKWPITTHFVASNIGALLLSFVIIKPLTIFLETCFLMFLLYPIIQPCMRATKQCRLRHNKVKFDLFSFFIECVRIPPKCSYINTSWILSKRHIFYTFPAKNNHFFSFL